MGKKNFGTVQGSPLGQLLQKIQERIQILANEVQDPDVLKRIKEFRDVMNELNAIIVNFDNGNKPGVWALNSYRKKLFSLADPYYLHLYQRHYFINFLNKEHLCALLKKYSALQANASVEDSKNALKAMMKSEINELVLPLNDVIHYNKEQLIIDINTFIDQFNFPPLGNSPDYNDFSLLLDNFLKKQIAVSNPLIYNFLIKLQEDLINFTQSADPNLLNTVDHKADFLNPDALTLPGISSLQPEADGTEFIYDIVKKGIVNINDYYRQILDMTFEILRGGIASYQAEVFFGEIKEELKGSRNFEFVQHWLKRQSFSSLKDLDVLNTELEKLSGYKKEMQRNIDVNTELLSELDEDPLKFIREYNDIKSQLELDERIDCTSLLKNHLKDYIEAQIDYAKNCLENKIPQFEEDIVAHINTIVDKELKEQVESKLEEINARKVDLSGSLEEQVALFEGDMSVLAHSKVIATLENHLEGIDLAQSRARLEECKKRVEQTKEHISKALEAIQVEQECRNSGIDKIAEFIEKNRGELCFFELEHQKYAQEERAVREEIEKKLQQQIESSHELTKLFMDASYVRKDSLDPYSVQETQAFFDLFVSKYSESNQVSSEFEQLEDKSDIERKLTIINAVNDYCKLKKGKVKLSELKKLPQLKIPGEPSDRLSYLWKDILGLEEDPIGRLGRHTKNSEEKGGIIVPLIQSKKAYYERMERASNYQEGKELIIKQKEYLNTLISTRKLSSFNDVFSQDFDLAKRLNASLKEQASAEQKIDELARKQQILHPMEELHRLLMAVEEKGLSEYAKSDSEIQQKFKELTQLVGENPVFVNLINAFQLKIMGIRTVSRQQFVEKQERLQEGINAFNDLNLSQINELIRLKNEIDSIAKLIPEFDDRVLELPLHNLIEKLKEDLNDDIAVDLDFNNIDDKDPALFNPKWRKFIHKMELSERYKSQDLKALQVLNPKIDLSQAIKNLEAIEQQVKDKQALVQVIHENNQQRIALVDAQIGCLNTYNDNRDQQDERADFIDNLIERLGAYKSNGNARLVLDYIHEEGPKHKGLNFQPLLNRMIIAIKDHEQQIEQPVVVEDGRRKSSYKRGDVNKAKDNLLIYINALEENAKTLSNPEPVEELAKGLRKRVEDFINALPENEDVDEETFKAFADDFKVRIHTQDDKMSTRGTDGYLYKNILIGVFGLGFVLGIQLVRTKLVDGYAHGFFFNTKSMDCVKLMDKQIKEAEGFEVSPVA